MIDKELIHQAAEDIDIFEADFTEEYERLCPKPRRLPLWPLAAAACAAGIAFILLMPPRTPSNSPLKGEKLAAKSSSPLGGGWEGSVLSLDAQLAYQQEIKEKGEKLAAFVRQYTSRNEQ